MAMCIALVAGAVSIVLSTSTMTLRWTHSVERVPWEEDYRAVQGGLMIVEARVVRSGAGMDPPEGSIFDGTWWRYTPDLGMLPDVKLANSAFAGGYSLCWRDGCHPLASMVPQGEVATVTSRECPAVQ